jgi:hypothetical protein
VDVELLGKLSYRPLALDGGKRHLRLERRCVVPARSSVHGLSCSRRLSPRSGRNSTYRLVQICGAGSEDLKLIRQIVAGGGRKYTAGNIDRSRYDRLVDLGWLIPFKTDSSDVEYQVTDEGRAAAAF